MPNNIQFQSGGQSHDVLSVSGSQSPLILSFPHSGSTYPDDFGYDPKLSFEKIDFPSDKYVDELFSEAQALGYSTIKANFPRAYVDVNRHQHDIDKDMIEGGENWYGRLLPGSVKVGATLFWSKSGGTPIYDRKLSQQEAKNRLAQYFIPYHQTMTSLIEEARKAHGCAYIVDCHSMTQFDTKVRGGKQRPEIDIGTRSGGSCAPDLSDKMAELFATRGYEVGINKRFVGGEITVRYGWPEIDQHIFQIELRRDLYMDEATRARGENFLKVKSDCNAILGEFKEYVAQRNTEITKKTENKMNDRRSS
jgi:N-formylglutamate deformylase